MQASNIITSGRFVSVTFQTKAGTLRTVSGRTGVKKYIKGTGTRPAKASKNYLLISVKDASGKYSEFKQINKNKIVEVRADGIQVSMNCASKFAKFI